MSIRALKKDQNMAVPQKDYKDTLFLPRTDFPMRAGLQKLEPKLLERWKKMGLFARLRADAAERPPYILHDGPPYANGHLHIGHAMNKILKDIIIRGRQMSGYDAHYLPGWDCHGLPIEWKVEEAFRAGGRPKNEVPAAEFRAACRANAEKWVDIQCQEFKRLGIEGNWEAPYLTMDFDSEARIMAEALKFVDNGLLYRGSKPVMWSPVEQTALAEAEVEYHDKQSTTIWVKFPLIAGLQAAEPAGSGAADLDGACIVIWTTTPWTIPGNRAVSYGPAIPYGLYEVTGMAEGLDFIPWAAPGDRFILADSLVEDVFAHAHVAGWSRLRDVTAEELASMRCAHPLHGFAGGYQFDVPLLAGSHVTDDAGTGFVHTAPGHGQDDYAVWLAHKLSLEDIPYTVGPDGAYTEEAPGFEGEKILVTSGKKTGRDGAANRLVIAQLIAQGNLLARGRITHAYPHSWRSKAPVIFRNTPQWFIRIGEAGTQGLRDKALSAIDQTDFFPPSGKARIKAMVEGRPDWLISRQRAWGVPIAIFVDRGTGLPLNDPEVNERILAAVRAAGADAWFETPPEDFLGDKYDPVDYDKVEDILDVWFDSGSTHAFVLEARAEELGLEGRIARGAPLADLYLEGTDQHRGWFQSSLLESCGTRDRAPYRAVLTHGFVLDEQGRKMSKSLGNQTGPREIIDQYGAEILRIWTASSDYSEDLRIGKEIIGSSVDGYRKLRNTIRYLLGATSGLATEIWEPQADGAGGVSGNIPDAQIPYGISSLAIENLPELEAYILHLLSCLGARVARAYAQHDLKAVWRSLVEFCTGDLSAFYLDIRKDSLYCDAREASARIAARQVMDICLQAILRWLAPICVFTAEEAYLHRFPAYGGGGEDIKNTGDTEDTGNTEDIGDTEDIGNTEDREYTEDAGDKEGRGDKEGKEYTDDIKASAHRERSIHLHQFLTLPGQWENTALAGKWDHIRSVRRVVTFALEALRRDKVIGSSLEAAPVIFIADEAVRHSCEAVDMAALAITSAITIEAGSGPAEAYRLAEIAGVAVVPHLAKGGKCARCWKIVPEVAIGEETGEGGADLQDICDRCLGAI